MSDLCELALEIGWLYHKAVIVIAKVQLNAALHEPFERYLVNCDGPLAAVDGRVIVPGRVHVSAVVGAELDTLYRPTFAVGQIAWLETGKKGAYLLGGVLVSVLFDLRQHERRIRLNVGFETHRDIDESFGHGLKRHFG